MKLTLLCNTDIYSPRHIGIGNILFCGSYILQIGKVDEKALLKTNLEIEVVDLKKNILVPGIIDPHAHLLGGSGENGGFSSQTPEIPLTELTTAGITTVVGTLGADNTMKTMAGLLAKVKGLNEQGLSAYLYTGGYSVPPASIMNNVRQDLMFIQEVIGTGEIAISDERSNEPDEKELARVVIDSYMGGMLSGKAGVTHFHVGPGKRRLQCLRDLLEYAPDIKPEYLYPTHIERSEKLVAEAIAFTQKGSFVDMDMAEGELAKWLKVYQKHGGDLSHLTISSDASKTSPRNIFSELRSCVLDHKFKLEQLLPLTSANPAKILKLEKKGEIKIGNEPSFLALDSKTLEIQHVISKGTFMVRDGKTVVREKFLEECNRVIDLVGEDA